MQLSVQENGLNIDKMSNGLYNGNNNFPTMTRSEYVDEYSELTTYYEQQKQEEKKYLPFYIAITVVAIAVIIYCICAQNIVGIFILWVLMAPLNYRRFLRRSGFSWKEITRSAMVTMFLFAFPLGSYINRIKQIDKKEKQKIQELEDRKAFCISIGTYDVEK